MSIRWADKVEAHDFDSAESYLSIKFDTRTARKLVHKLRDAKVTTRRVNDILRACRLPPLGYDDPGVRHTMAKVDAGKKLSPVLLVSLYDGADIADGYHRVSLTYQTDPFAYVPLVIVSLDRP